MGKISCNTTNVKNLYIDTITYGCCVYAKKVCRGYDVLKIGNLYEGGDGYLNCVRSDCACICSNLIICNGNLNNGIGNGTVSFCFFIH